MFFLTEIGHHYAGTTPKRLGLGKELPKTWLLHWGARPSGPGGLDLLDGNMPYWVVDSNVIFFHPEHLGKMWTHFDDHIFLMGVETTN